MILVTTPSSPLQVLFCGFLNRSKLKSSSFPNKFPTLVSRWPSPLPPLSVGSYCPNLLGPCKNLCLGGETSRLTASVMCVGTKLPPQTSLYPLVLCPLAVLFPNIVSCGPLQLQTPGTCFPVGPSSCLAPRPSLHSYSQKDT